MVFAKKNCAAYNKEVVFQAGVNLRSNLQDNVTNIKCPICLGILLPKTCGFYKCKYKFQGDKIAEGQLKHINIWPKETIGDNFDYFDPFENGSVIWINLDIYAYEK